jgi:hypothetical protein
MLLSSSDVTAEKRTRGVHEKIIQRRVNNGIHQYSETKVMHFLFSLLRIKGLYMFRALLAHPQEAVYKWHLVYCVRVMSVGCTRVGAAN